MGAGCKVAAAWLVVLALLVYINVAVWPMFDEWVYTVPSVAEIVPQVWHEYFVWNGRIVNTVLARVYSLLPVWSVDALIILGWIIYLCLIAYLALGRAFRDSLRHWYTPLLVWSVALFFILDLWFTSTWHTGTTSYLWTANLAMGFLAVFRRYLSGDACAGQVQSWAVSWRRWLWLAPLAFLAGWSNYNVGPTVAALFALFLLWRWRELKPVWPMLVLLGLVGLGALLMDIAPGNMVRSESVNRGEIDWWFCVRRNVMQLQYLTFFYTPVLVLAGVGVLCRVLRGEWVREDTRVMVMALGGAVLATLAYVPSPVMPTGYSFHFIGTMYAVAAVRVFYPYVDEARHRRVWRAVLLVVFAVPVLIVFSRCRDYVYSYQKLEECYALIEAKKNTGGDLVLPRQREYAAFPWRELTGYWGLRQVGPYLGQLHAWCAGLGLGTDPDSHFNKAAARAWGLRSVRMPFYQASYTAAGAGWRLEAKEFEQAGTRTLRGEICGELSREDRLYVHVAMPRSLRGISLLRAYAARWQLMGVVPASHEQLLAMGYEVRTMELLCGDSATVRFCWPLSRSWVVAAPWVAVSSSPAAPLSGYVPLRVEQNESEKDDDPETGLPLH